MKRPLLLFLIFLVCLAPPLFAQEVEPGIGVINDVDVIVTNLTEEKLNNPPKRETKFERVMEPFQRKLERPDPKLIEQKYAASFLIALLIAQPDDPSWDPIYVRPQDGDIYLQQFLRNSCLVWPLYRQNLRADTSTKGFFQRLVKFTPKDKLPAASDVEHLTGDLMDNGYIDIHEMRRATDEQFWSIRVLGGTAEEAERRAAAILTLLDQGASRPVQVAIFKKRQDLCRELREQRASLASARQRESALRSALTPFEEFTPDMLPNLRVQQLQLDIDLAGVKARVAACDRLLEKLKDVPLERRKQVEDVRTSAEIELSGFTARREKSEEFIAKVKNKIALSGELGKTSTAASRVAQTVQSLERRIREADYAIKNYGPLPLVDNKVIIQPLEWTQ